jgi:hypothetical protein
MLSNFGALMSASQFEVDEIVCVKDRGKIYEAKIIKTQQWSNNWNYFVHFQGWNKKWDRWTLEGEVTKKTGSVGRMGQSDGSVEEPSSKKVWLSLCQPHLSRGQEMLLAPQMSLLNFANISMKTIL